MSRNVGISVAIGLVAVALTAGFYLNNRQASSEVASEQENDQQQGDSRPLVSTASNWEGSLSSSDSSAEASKSASGSSSSQSGVGAKDPKISRLFEASKAQLRLESGKKNLERMVQEGFAQQMMDSEDGVNNDELLKAFTNHFDADKIYARYQELVQESMTPQEVDQLTDLFQNSPEVSEVLGVLNQSDSFTDEDMPKLMTFIENLEQNPLPEDRRQALETYYDLSMSKQRGLTDILSAQFEGMKEPYEKAAAKYDPNDQSPAAKDIREKLAQLNEIQTHIQNSEEEMQTELRTQGIKGAAFAARDMSTEKFKAFVNGINIPAYAKNQEALAKATSEATTAAMRAMGRELSKADLAHTEKQG